ncbi:MAG TPA: AI-2E family transporter, partial [Longimicrobiaceae bacterium]|nr:AI-2E family transporter [Longimicrobiaceae bacterium]
MPPGASTEPDDPGAGAPVPAGPQPSGSFRAPGPGAPPGPVPLRPEHLYKSVGLLFLLALLLRFFDPITQVLLLAYASAILAVALNALASRLPLGRKWVAALAGAGLLAVLVALLWLGAPALMVQVRDLAADAPQIQARIREWGEWVYRQTGIRIPLLGRGGGGGQPLPQLRGGEVIGRARGLLEVILLMLILVFGGLYAMASPNERLLNPLLRACPRGFRPDVYRILELLGERLVGWLKGTGIAMLGVGALSVLAFSLIGVPNALALGIFNGLMEFIPIFGPWIGGAAATLVAFIADPSKGVWTAVVALA